ncbi:universal stress protein [Streptosporangium sp. NPDC048047]|uniref:universal stress protein n=1 Tax=Streptosporangium sp. NPDC048047 TaxID=3155748 RepID=UPI00341761E8
MTRGGDAQLAARIHFLSRVAYGAASRPRAGREIVVAFDGSAQSRAAVEWAARACGVRGGRLTVCHVWDGPRAEREAAVTARERGLAGLVLSEGVELAERLLPGRAVRPVLLRGDPGAELVSLGRTAEMLVLGARGRGGTAGLLVGSVSAHVAAHAACPVLAVRGTESAAGRAETVVVGVDGSACSLAALRFALGYARGHRLPIHAIHARRDGPGRPGEELERWVAEAVAELPRGTAGVTVTTSTVGGPPLPVLLPGSHRARLLVVGSRGLGPVRSRLLGSVSREVLRRAGCTVAVVKDRD